MASRKGHNVHAGMTPQGSSAHKYRDPSGVGPTAVKLEQRMQVLKESKNHEHAYGQPVNHPGRNKWSAQYSKRAPSEAAQLQCNQGGVLGRNTVSPLQHVAHKTEYRYGVCIYTYNSNS